MERIPPRRIFTESGSSCAPPNPPLHQPKPRRVHLRLETQRGSRRRCIIGHRLAASQVNGKPLAAR